MTAEVHFDQKTDELGPDFDREIDELLNLVGIRPANIPARRWMAWALSAGKHLAKARGQPFSAEQNASIDRVSSGTDLLFAALEGLKAHPYAHERFWSAARANNVEEINAMSVLRTISQAADDPSVRRTGRRPKLLKQHIVNLPLAFSARFLSKKPSSNENNFFPAFAERFFEYATGLSPENKGHGIARQIRVALQRLPVEMERAALLNETPPK